MTDWLMVRYVRPKFLQYSYSDVCDSIDVDELKLITKWYSPQSQPRNHVEWTYVFGIEKLAIRRLNELTTTRQLQSHYC